MEDKYREIRIGVFGGNAQNKIDWLKHLYKFFMLNEYNDRELTEKRIFKSDFSLRIPYYNNTIILLPFKEGSFKMAEKTGCPIIPMALTNTSAI